MWATSGTVSRLEALLLCHGRGEQEEREDREGAAVQQGGGREARGPRREHSRVQFLIKLASPVTAALDSRLGKVGCTSVVGSS